MVQFRQSAAAVEAVLCSTVAAMAPSEITRAGILQAIAEHDQLGPEAFRDAYGFHAAAIYFLQYEGKLYDSKAIAGVAHRYDFGRALKPSQLSGASSTQWRGSGGKASLSWSRPSPSTGGWETSVRHVVQPALLCIAPSFCSGRSDRLWLEPLACSRGRSLEMRSRRCW